MTDFLPRLCQRLHAFARDRRANVAMMFGLALVPIIVASGAGLDYARAALARSQLNDALDAAALAVGSTTGLNQSNAQTLAQQYFNANYKGTDKPQVSANYDSTTGQVTLSASSTINTALMKVVGTNQLTVSASSTVVWGQGKLWVALVLDNSGSMASSGKMSALISASQQMLTTLQNASSNPGDVQVGIVPFVSVVNVGKANVSQSWIDWSDWDAAPVTSAGTKVADGYTVPKTNILFDAYGPGDDCPFTTTSSSYWGTSVSNDSPFGYNCTKSASNGAAAVGTATNNGNPVSPIPSSGLICPGQNSTAYSNDHLARYYNGCWSSTKLSGQTIQVAKGSSATCGLFSSSNCSCSGSNSSKVCSTQRWQHVWVPNSHSSWSGCIMDRTQPYDIQNTQPSGNSTGMSATNPAPTSLCPAATVTPLGYNWSNLNSQIGAMKANGSTNQAIGVAHGWQMLTPGAPYGTPALPDNTTRYIILLSDGLNTQDRWWGDGGTENSSDDAKIDDRMNQACSAAKADGVVIYTVYVNINNSDGNSTPLQNCASDSSKFFPLSSASQISTAFATIAQQITNLRVAK